MDSDKFAVFILTHGRPDRMITYKTLLRQGYTGDIYVIVDNEDETIDEYRRQFGKQVIMFDKLAIGEQFDQGDNFHDRRTITYARNASFEIAEDLGLDYFLQLDDDYTRLLFKFDGQLVWKEQAVKDLDRLFAIVLEYYKSIPAPAIALAQNGDFIGGAIGDNASRIWLKRKAMNSFFCSVKRPFEFVGSMNEDVNTYVTLGNRGRLFLTVMQASLIQGQTQQSAGGSSEFYLDHGTYQKAFYTIMYMPSCVKIGDIGYRHMRIHHRITWADAVPCIIREELRKAPSA